MSLKVYMNIQRDLFKKYSIDKMIFDDIILFNQICSRLELIKEVGNTNAEKLALSLIEELIKEKY